MLRVLVWGYLYLHETSPFPLLKAFFLLSAVQFVLTCLEPIPSLWGKQAKTIGNRLGFNHRVKHSEILQPNCTFYDRRISHSSLNFLRPIHHGNLCNLLLGLYCICLTVIIDAKVAVYLVIMYHYKLCQIVWQHLPCKMYNSISTYVNL